jgi:hypothetical protein
VKRAETATTRDDTGQTPFAEVDLLRQSGSSFLPRTAGWAASIAGRARDTIGSSRTPLIFWTQDQPREEGGGLHASGPARLNLLRVALLGAVEVCAP